MSDLGRLRAATNDAIAVVSSSAQKPSGPVNWGDLHCRQASWVITDDGSEYPEVLIEEASPDATEFQSAVTAKLERSGWPGVNVVTAW